MRATARAASADEVLALLEEASDSMAKGRPGPAELAATRAKGLASRSASVREALGLALYHLERYKEALRELQAYRRMTGRVDHNHVMADAHRALGAPDKAVPLAREALAAPPRALSDEARAEAAVVGGAALADLNRFDEALTVLRTIKTATGVARPYDLRVWYVTGDVLERAGRRSDAAREFARIVRHDASAFDAAERLASLA